MRQPIWFLVVASRFDRAEVSSDPCLLPVWVTEEENAEEVNKNYIGKERPSGRIEAAPYFKE